jgi:hypothetical protein
LPRNESTSLVKNVSELNPRLEVLQSSKEPSKFIIKAKQSKSELLRLLLQEKKDIA